MMNYLTEDGGMNTRAEKMYALLRKFQMSKPEDRYKFIGFKEMAMVAKETNNWLYDGRDKTWYTPEEFLTHYANMLSGHAEFLLRIEIKSPIVAIELSLSRIEMMQTRVMAFTKRFIQYTKSKR